MADSSVKQFSLGLSPIIGLTILLLVSLQLMANATEDASSFGRLYSLVLVVNFIGIAALGLLIGRNLWRLKRQLKQRVAGARLTARMLIMFVVLSVIPLLVVYSFSLQFLHRGINSWFNVQVEQALEDALTLSKMALDARMQTLQKLTMATAEDLSSRRSESVAIVLGELREKSPASEMSMFTSAGRIIASINIDPTIIVPDNPDEATLLQVRESGRYIGLEPTADGGIQIRALVTVPDAIDVHKDTLLQALYPIPARMNTLSAHVQKAFAQYRELAYLREPLITSFTLTLSLVLLLSLLAAVWAAFFSAQKLAEPIKDLAEGTRAVAEGNYETQLPQSGHDEMAFLVRSFNEMTRKLLQARNETHQIQQAVEEQKTYLEAILSRLSSGVVTYDKQHQLTTSNKAASDILAADLSSCMYKTSNDISLEFPHIEPLLHTLKRHMDNAPLDWRDEITLFGPNGRQQLICSGTPLADEHVVVFDDVTHLIKAQKQAAWTEVAKRLAHEIKNPLTPIQLSAERIQHKFIKVLPEKDKPVMDRLTHTIVQQVMVMKDMVNSFSNYARTPEMKPEPLDVNSLIRDVLELYRYTDGEKKVVSELSDDLPLIDADKGRLRQLFHNLIKNALEAEGGQQPRKVLIKSFCHEKSNCSLIEVQVEDNGGGFDDELIDSAFEPYITSKKKGSGLGLAIVSKIIDEHGGTIRIKNQQAGGASVNMCFPVSTKS